MNRPIRILLVWPWFRILSSNYGEMLEKNGFEVAIFTAKNPWDQDKLNFRGVEVSEKIGVRFFSEIFLFIKYKIRFKPDIVILEPTIDLRFIAQNLIKAPMKIVAIHDPKPHDFSDQPNFIKQKILNLSSMKYQDLLAFSTSSKNELGSRYKWSLIPEIPNSKMLSVKSNKSKRNFVVFGRLKPYQNIEYLIQIWKTYFSELCGEELHIYGWSQQTICAPGIVHFNSRFNRTELLQRLPNYRAALFPYLSISQSGTLLLAQSCGLPALTTNLPGFREFLPDNNYDFIDLENSKNTILILKKYLNSEYLDKVGKQTAFKFKNNLEIAEKDVCLFSQEVNQYLINSD